MCSWCEFPGSKLKYLESCNDIKDHYCKICEGNYKSCDSMKPAHDELHMRFYMAHIFEIKHKISKLKTDNKLSLSQELECLTISCLPINKKEICRNAGDERIIQGYCRAKNFNYDTSEESLETRMWKEDDKWYAVIELVSDPDGEFIKMAFSR